MLVLPGQSSGHHQGQSHTAGGMSPNDTEDTDDRRMILPALKEDFSVCLQEDL